MILSYKVYQRLREYPPHWDAFAKDTSSKLSHNFAIGTLKGKTVNQRPPPVVDTAIEVPKELLMRLEHLPLCMDIMFVNELPFLTTLTKKLHYRSTIPMANRLAPTIRASLDKVFRLHDGHGVQISQIHCDNEFKSLFESIKDDLDVRYL